MYIELNQPHLSIREMNRIELPDFSVVIGRNGVGKTQLLDAIANGFASVSDTPTSEIEKYDVNSFQPGILARAGWGHGVFSERTAERYFSNASGPAPAEIAKNIYFDTLENSQLKEGSETHFQFKESLLDHICQIPDFEYFPRIKGDAALSAYSQAIWSDVIEPLSLKEKEQQRRSSRAQKKDKKDSCGNDSAVLVSLAMKLTRKLPHELLREDVLRAAYYEGNIITNNVSQAFTKYKVEQYAWAHSESEAGEKSVRELMNEYREKTCPPWITLRRNLEQMREASGDMELFDFEFSDPEKDQLHYADHQQYFFEAQFTNRATGASYSVQDLSSGEKILMTLCLASFNQNLGRRQPRLVLLDELDALLHPSMISAFISGLKDQFVSNGTRIILATHSVTTVSMLEDGEVFRLGRNAGKVDAQPVSKSQAVAELSEGLATIDTGLRIATSEEAAPITILTEGHNALHLRKWADLYFPGKVHVFTDLIGKTGKDQLLAYGQLLAKMSTNVHFLIVWDCDAKRKAQELENELSGYEKVTPFAFRKRKNQYAPKGIENMYEEKILEGYCTITSEANTGKVIARAMDNSKKKEFASHVSCHGTKEYFEHFSDLQTTVEDILGKIDAN